LKATCLSKVNFGVLNEIQNISSDHRRLANFYENTKDLKEKYPKNSFFLNLICHAVVVNVNHSAEKNISKSRSEFVEENYEKEKYTVGSIRFEKFPLGGMLGYFGKF
jgi:hypothetical protein